MSTSPFFNRYRSADTSPDSSPLHISSSQSGGGPADIGDLSSPLAAADAGIVAAAVAAAALATAASSSGGGYKTVSQSEWDEMQGGNSKDIWAVFRHIFWPFMDDFFELAVYRVSHPIVREISSCFVSGVPLPCLGSS